MAASVGGPSASSIVPHDGTTQTCALLCWLSYKKPIPQSSLDRRLKTAYENVKKKKTPSDADVGALVEWCDELNGFVQGFLKDNRATVIFIVNPHSRYYYFIVERHPDEVFIVVRGSVEMSNLVDCRLQSFESFASAHDGELPNNPPWNDFQNAHITTAVVTVFNHCFGESDVTLLFTYFLDAFQRRATEVGRDRVKVVLTGHSMGGLVASLLTTKLLRLMSIHCGQTTFKPTVTTFGTPTCGDITFQRGMDRLCQQQTRIYCQDDSVALLWNHNTFKFHHYMVVARYMPTSSSRHQHTYHTSTSSEAMPLPVGTKLDWDDAHKILTYRNSVFGNLWNHGK